MKKIIALFSFMFCAGFIFAQITTDSTSIAASTGETVIGWIKENYIWMLPMIYELLIRIIPTAKDWSITKLIQFIIDNILPPNRTKDGETHNKNNIFIKVKMRKMGDGLKTEKLNDNE